jgi:hypothetical protein
MGGGYSEESAGGEEAESCRVCIDRLLWAAGWACQQQCSLGPAVSDLPAPLLAHTVDLWLRCCVYRLSLLAAVATGTLRGLYLFER